MWGLTTIQVIGIAIGSLALLAALVAIVLLLVKKCAPGCKHFKFHPADTQILVIEGPEEPDDDDESDPEDST